jgi:heme oxygenase (biliverdin-IX-beta and delta-forming)
MTDRFFPALAELRRATSDLHLRLEAVLDVNREGASCEDYLAYLKDMYGWLHTVEPALWQAPWPTEMASGERAGKLQRIHADLAYAGMTEHHIHDLPSPHYMPDFGLIECRYGVAYVVEGAQLGVRVLAKRLEPRLGGWQPAWLQGYGIHSAQRWKTFIASAEAELRTPQARQAAAEHARQAFTSVLHWFMVRHNARKDSEVTIPGGNR